MYLIRLPALSPKGNTDKYVTIKSISKKSFIQIQITTPGRVRKYFYGNFFQYEIGCSKGIKTFLP